MTTEWKTDRGLLYRLTAEGGFNCDEIDITQVGALVLAGVLNDLPEGDLTDQILALAEDAERYRWLRNEGRHNGFAVEQDLGHGIRAHCATSLDEAIDAARGAK